MAVIGGKNGAAKYGGTAIGTLRNWSANVSNESQAYVASNTAGAEAVVVGNEDWNGQADAYGAIPCKMPGEGFTFLGSVDGSVGITGDVIVDQVEITIPIEEGGLISHRLSFSGNGAYALGAAVAAADTDPDAPTAVSRKLQITSNIAAPSYADIDHVRSITITISADNKAYNTSGTGGDTARVAGNLSGSLAYELYEGAVANLPTSGVHYGFRAFTSATEYWAFEWGIITEISGLECNRETGDLVSASVTAKWSGYATSGGTVYQGELTDPDVATFWP